MIESIDWTTVEGILLQAANAIEDNGSGEERVDGILVGLDVTMKVLKVPEYRKVFHDLMESGSRWDDAAGKHVVAEQLRRLARSFVPGPEDVEGVNW